MPHREKHRLVQSRWQEVDSFPLCSAVMTDLRSDFDKRSEETACRYDISEEVSNMINIYQRDGGNWNEMSIVFFVFIIIAGISRLWGKNPGSTCNKMLSVFVIVLFRIWFISRSWVIKNFQFEWFWQNFPVLNSPSDKFRAQFLMNK